MNSSDFKIEVPVFKDNKVDITEFGAVKNNSSIEASKNTAK